VQIGALAERHATYEQCHGRQRSADNELAHARRARASAERGRELASRLERGERFSSVLVRRGKDEPPTAAPSLFTVDRSSTRGGKRVVESEWRSFPTPR
jgi:hypothetical protein